MLKLIFKALWKVITYLVAAAILGVIISAFFSPVAGVIVAAIGVLGMIPAIKDEMMKEDIPKYREERKRKKLMKDDGKSFGMRRDIDVENMGFDSMINGGNMSDDFSGAVCPACGSNVDISMKFCPNCGKRIG